MALGDRVFYDCEMKLSIECLSFSFYLREGRASPPSYRVCIEFPEHPFNQYVAVCLRVSE